MTRRRVVLLLLAVLAAVVAEALVVARKLHVFEARVRLEGSPDVLEFSADGRLLLASNWHENKYTILEVGNPLDMKYGARRSQAGESVCCHLAPDGRFLLRLQQLPGGVFPAEYELVLDDLMEGRVRWRSRTAVDATFRFSPEGRRFLYTSGSDVCVCEVPDGREVLRAKRPPKLGGDVVFSPDGKLLGVGGSSDGGSTSAAIEDATDGRTIRVFPTPAGQSPGAWCVRFSRDDRVLIAANWRQINAWNLADGVLLWTSREKPTASFEITLDGRLILLAGPPLCALDARSGRLLGELRVSAEGRGLLSVTAMGLSRDGESIALGWETGKIEILDMRSFLARFEPPLTSR